MSNNVWELKFVFNDKTEAKVLQEAYTEVSALTQVLEVWGPPKPITEIHISPVEYIDISKKTTPLRDDDVANWIKDWREQYSKGTERWCVLDDVLDDYRLHADTGTPLTEEVEAP